MYWPYTDFKLYVCKRVVCLRGCPMDPFHVGNSGSFCVGVCGGGVLWLVGFQMHVKDLVGGESQVIVQVVVVCVFSVDVEAFYSI